jgi:hypothetical protein
MPLPQQSGVQMSVKELRRTGSGDIEATDTSFEWSGLTHSSMQNTLSFKLMSKIVRKVLPGSNTVVHQAMSAAWEPFTIGGEWDDKWMGRGQAMETYLAFARFIQKMPLARVTIDSLSFVGMIQDLEIDYLHENKIGWKFTVSPEENENVTSDVLMGTGELVTKKSIPQWYHEAQISTDALQSVSTVAANIPLQTEDLEDVQSSLDGLNDALTQIEQLSTFSAAVIDVAQSVIQGQSVQDLVTNGLTAGIDVTDIVWQLPAAYARLMNASLTVLDSVIDKRPDTSCAYDDLIQELRFAQLVHQTTTGAWQNIGVATDAIRDLKSRASQKPRAIYIPKPGESLERISNRYYGTPDNANLIYIKNSLRSIVLSGTEELIIPEPGA